MSSSLEPVHGAERFKQILSQTLTNSRICASTVFSCKPGAWQSALAARIFRRSDSFGAGPRAASNDSYPPVMPMAAVFGPSLLPAPGVRSVLNYGRGRAG